MLWHFLYFFTRLARLPLISLSFSTHASGLFYAPVSLAFRFFRSLCLLLEILLLVLLALWMLLCSAELILVSKVYSIVTAATDY